MEKAACHLKNKYNLLIFSVIIISSTVTALLAVKHLKISPDSMIYSLISQQLISGNGIRLPIIRLVDTYVFVNGTAPYLEQPPLLPILFALMGGVTAKNFLSAQIINTVSHVAISIFTFLLMKKLYNSRGIALLSSMLVSLSFPVLWNTSRMLSESLFVALIVAALYFLIASRNADNYPSAGNLFTASICASAAILTRFAGVTLIPVFFWEAFMLLKNKRIKTNNLSVLLTASLPVIAAGALFIYTYSVSGTLFGYHVPSPERSYPAAFIITMKMMFLQFQVGQRFITLLPLLAILFVICIMNGSIRRELSRSIHSGLDLIIVFMVCYTMLITYAMAESQTVIESRYMSPLAPFLFIFCIIVIVAARDTIRFKGLTKLSLCGIILSLGIISFGNFYKTYSNSGAIFPGQAGHYRILNSPAYKWIKENYRENVIITSNRPYHLSFFGGYSTVRLPHRRFNVHYRIPDDMESLLPERMTKFGSRVLALFEEADEQHEGPYISKLFNRREDDDNFTLVHTSPDGVIYELKE